MSAAAHLPEDERGRLGRRVFLAVSAAYAALLVVQKTNGVRVGVDWISTAPVLPAVLVDVALYATFVAAAFLLVRLLPADRINTRAAVGAACGATLLAAVLLLGRAHVQCTVMHMGCRYPTSVVAIMVPGLLFNFFGLTAVAYAFRFAAGHRRAEIAAARLEESLADARLSALKSQLHPHFLFNALNSVSALAEDDPAAARAMLGRLRGLLERTLERADAQEVPLAEELAFLELYTGIERVRFSDRLRLEVSVQPGAESARVPHLLLQPLVENAIRHGIAARPGPGCITVTAAAMDGALRISVADDGPGPDGCEGSAGNGVGLANTRARLAALYGARHSFRIAAREGGGTRVDVAIPLSAGR